MYDVHTWCMMYDVHTWCMIYDVHTWCMMYDVHTWCMHLMWSTSMRRIMYHACPHVVLCDEVLYCFYYCISVTLYNDDTYTKEKQQNSLLRLCYDDRWQITLVVLVIGVLHFQCLCLIIELYYMLLRYDTCMICFGECVQSLITLNNKSTHYDTINQLTAILLINTNNYLIKCFELYVCNTAFTTYTFMIVYDGWLRILVPMRLDDDMMLYCARWW